MTVERLARTWLAVLAAGVVNLSWTMPTREAAGCGAGDVMLPATEPLAWELAVSYQSPSWALNGKTWGFANWSTVVREADRRVVATGWAYPGERVRVSPPALENSPKTYWVRTSARGVNARCWSNPVTVQ